MAEVPREGRVPIFVWSAHRFAELDLDRLFIRLVTIGLDPTPLARLAALQVGSELASPSWNDIL